MNKESNIEIKSHVRQNPGFLFFDLLFAILLSCIITYTLMTAVCQLSKEQRLLHQHAIAHTILAEYAARTLQRSFTEKETTELRDGTEFLITKQQNAISIPISSTFPENQCSLDNITVQWQDTTQTTHTCSIFTYTPAKFFHQRNTGA
jgi:hypothetical protein